MGPQARPSVGDRESVDEPFLHREGHGFYHAAESENRKLKRTNRICTVLSLGLTLVCAALSAGLWFTRACATVNNEIYCAWGGRQCSLNESATGLT